MVSHKWPVPFLFVFVVVRVCVWLLRKSKNRNVFRVGENIFDIELVLLSAPALLGFWLYTGGEHKFL